mmetsp:Transcript_7919/g.16547  ORF Transcript_7919/g.16547 Transcript_7919/m.16547 type:complete len:277 (-) Transcript_7919:636-1466(-)
MRIKSIHKSSRSALVVESDGEQVLIGIGNQRELVGAILHQEGCCCDKGIAIADSSLKGWINVLLEFFIRIQHAFQVVAINPSSNRIPESTHHNRPAVLGNGGCLEETSKVSGQPVPQGLSIVAGRIKANAVQAPTIVRATLNHFSHHNPIHRIAIVQRHRGHGGRGQFHNISGGASRRHRMGFVPRSKLKNGHLSSGPSVPFKIVHHVQVTRGGTVEWRSIDSSFIDCQCARVVLALRVHNENAARNAIVHHGVDGISIVHQHDAARARGFGNTRL